MDRIEWIMKAIGYGVFWGAFVFVIGFFAVTVYNLMNLISDLIVRIIV